MRWFFFTTWWRGGRSKPVHSTDESEVIWWKWKWSNMMTRFSIVSMPAQDDQRSTMLCWKYPRCLQIAPLLAMYRLLRCLYHDQHSTANTLWWLVSLPMLGSLPSSGEAGEEVRWPKPSRKFFPVLKLILGNPLVDATHTEPEVNKTKTKGSGVGGWRLERSLLS